MADTEKKIDINSVKLTDLDKKYISLRGINSSGNAYFEKNDGAYHQVFMINDGKAYEIVLEPDGKLYREDQPVVALGDVQVPAKDKDGNPVLDKDGFPTTKAVDGIYYNALSNIQNPYNLHDELQWDTIVGKDDHAKAVAFIQALKLYVQGINKFAFEWNLATEAFLLDNLFGQEGELPLVSTYGKPAKETTTTTSTTVQPTTTTTTTTSTTVKK